LLTGFAHYLEPLAAQFFAPYQLLVSNTLMPGLSSQAPLPRGQTGHPGMMTSITGIEHLIADQLQRVMVRRR
jgi:hypothetical protein